MTPSLLSTILKKNQHIYRPVVPFNQEQDKLLAMDFTLTNKALNPDILNNTAGFAKYIEQELKNSNARYGIGGYNEHRTIYSRSKYFDSPTGEEPRRLHLGIDIWGSAGTPVFAALGGMVHSFGFNNNYGDYGATIILLHQLDGYAFYTLYGHLSLKDIEHLQEGNYIIIGQEFGHFGMPEENGNWPPHLHFQVITEMGWKRGDYPGVCKYSEREKYLDNCPNPDLILNMMHYAVTESSI